MEELAAAGVDLGDDPQAEIRASLAVQQEQGRDLPGFTPRVLDARGRKDLARAFALTRDPDQLLLLAADLAEKAGRYAPQAATEAELPQGACEAVTLLARDPARLLAAAQLLEDGGRAEAPARSHSQDHSPAHAQAAGQ